MLVRGYRDGKRYSQEVAYKPYVFLHVPPDWEDPPGVAKYKTLDGRLVSRKDFDSVWEAREFIKQYQDVSGFEIHGYDDWVTTYIYDTWHAGVDYDPSVVRVLVIDIEVSTEGGMDPGVIDRADRPITTVSVRQGRERLAFGYRDFVPEPGDEFTYIRCVDEADLLHKLLDTYERLDPDVVTGWNIEFFDVPYLVNRITSVLGEAHARRLSPWGLLREKTVTTMGRSQRVFDPIGVAVLDYMRVYKKFVKEPRDSYRLDEIARVEVGARKLDYSDVGGLNDLYREDFSRYVRYNARDVDLVHDIDAKLGLIELVMAVAYDARVGYQDALGSVKVWESIIHAYLMDRRVVVPPKPMTYEGTLVGGHVKEVAVGMHDWVVSFDLASLYPHLIMQYNISPETKVGRLDRGGVSWQDHVDDVLEGRWRHDPSVGDVAVAANLTTYRRDVQGFLPALMERMFADRDRYKREMKEAKTAALDATDPAEKRRLEDLASRLNLFQLGKKVELNSAYGVLSNVWFRFYSFAMAEAITTSGQLSIRWAERAVNAKLNALLGTDGVDYVVASDTDSLYIVVDACVRASGLPTKTEEDRKRVIDFLDRLCERVLTPAIEEAYAELAVTVNAREQKMRMKRECIADRGVWVAKKCYVLNVWDNEGLRYREPEIKMMGISAVKSSTPSHARDMIKRAISLVMTSDESSVIDFIDAYRREFSSIPLDEVAFPRGVSDLEKWADPAAISRPSCPIHVHGSLTYNHHVRRLGLEDRYPLIYSGDKVKYTYLRRPNPIGSHVIATPDGRIPEEFGLTEYIDHDTQFEKAFLDPLKIVLNAIGWRTERRAELTQFFS